MIGLAIGLVPLVGDIGMVSLSLLPVVKLSLTSSLTIPGRL